SSELLAQILRALDRNHSSVVSIDTASASLSSSAAARINGYWFLSLILSLSAALVGILCKQWVREFGRDVARTPKEHIGVRQMKYEGFEAWRVGTLVSAVPLILQISLALFIVGVLELVWRLSTPVAVLVSIAAGAAGIFYLGTTFLPAVEYVRAAVSTERRAQCPYKSPQAWIAL
ncbi:hypothetical protein AURDEDRAFT_31521, partial [Auricularia subglabra TFB-10046 SS5]